MVKISVISDLHLGFKKGTEREEDAFEAAELAFKKARDLGSNLIILAGDLFDSRFPRPEHWSRFIRLLSIFKDNQSVSLSKKRNKDFINQDSLKGVPVIAIHGTHERRGENLMNPIEAVEQTGLLVHLHCNSIVLDIEGERVAIHGMSGVPEKYSKEVLNKWNPKPFEGAYNIFMIHQDLDPYIYNPVNPPKLGLEDLPNGFDCYISGHIHWRDKTEVQSKPFIIPGSLIPTQLKKKEAEIEKGFYFLDTQSEEIDFIDIEPPREFFYEEIEVKERSINEIKRNIKERVQKISSKKLEKKPLIKVKLNGELPEGTNPNDLNLNSIKKNFREDVILNISNSLEETDTQDKIQMLRDIRNEKLSVEEIGMKMLRKQLEETGSEINPGIVFQDLAEGNVDKVMKGLLQEGGKKNLNTSEEETEGKNKNEWWK